MKITLFSEPDFKGKSQELPLGRYDIDVLKSGIGNDAVSSLLVPQGLKVTLFKHSGFSTEIGACQQDTRTLGSNNRQVSSVVVELLPGYFYRIKAEYSGLALEIKDHSLENEAALCQQEFTGDESQQFEFIALSDGHYKIVARHSQKVLGAQSSIIKDGTGIVQQDWSDADHQKWTLDWQRDGTVFIRSKNNPLLVFDSGANTDKGQNTTLYTRHGVQKNRLFRIERVVDKKPADTFFPKPDLTYRLYNVSSNQPVGIVDDAVAPGAPVEQQLFDTNRTSQYFQFEEIVTGLYKIKNAASGKYLGIPQGNTADGVAATQEDWDNQLHQGWRLYLLENGNFILTALHSQKVLDLDYAQKGAGVKIQQWTRHDYSHQQFRLEAQPLAPKLHITAPAAVCAPATVDLTAPAITTGSDAGALAYFHDEKLEQNVRNPEAVDKGGTYYIQLITPDGRTSSAPVQVVVHPQPKLPITNPPAVCWDKKTDLTAAAITAGRDAGALAYFKDEALTQPLPGPKAVDAGTYYIRLTTDNGCSIVKPVVAAAALPRPKLPVTNPPAACWDKKTDLTAAAITAGRDAGALAYFKDAALTQPLPDPKAVDAGTYYIRLTTDNGCVVAQPVTATAHPKPKLPITNPPTVCWDKKTDLTAEAITTGRDAGALAYFKDIALTQPIPDPKAVDAGTYYIRLSVDNGCTLAQPVVATAYSKPKLVINAPQPVCGSVPFNLKAAAITQGSDPGELSYFNDAALTQPLNKPEAAAAGTYYIQLKTDKGCTVSAAVACVSHPIPELVVVQPAPVCNGFKFKLKTAVPTPVANGSKLEYSADQKTYTTLSEATEVGAGVYQVRLTNQFGCSTTASVEVKEYPVPKLKVVDEEWAYMPDKVDLTMPYTTAGSDKGTLAYFKDAALKQPLTPQQAAAVDPGDYYIQLTSPEGCKSGVVKIKATVRPRPSMMVPIHVDARYIAETTLCASPRLDHSRLPYYDGEKDINPYTPYLGEELEAVPFDNGEFELQKGVHLHWALPDFLTKSFRYPMLDLGALRRATRINRLGEEQQDKLYKTLFDTFIQRGWVKAIPGNNAYASILAATEQTDIAISELLTDADPGKQALGQEILRVRSLLEPGGTQMPPVPNRWRVIRTGGGAPAKDWTVESDFLRAADKGGYQTGVPFPRPSRKPQEAPYGWLGRTYASGTPPGAQEGEYLGMPLTTLGYGEPTFAAFYPNCHSVFGLHDDTAEAGKTYTYEIYGYYAPENRDYEYFDLLRKDLANRTEKPQLRQALTEYLRDQLKLPPTDTTPGVWPDCLACCGRINVATTRVSDGGNSPITVTVGSNSAEAVSAYLADKISKTKKIEVEEYLESLQYLKRLEHLQTDIGPKLREERHRQGFTSEKGGYRWVLAPRQTTGEPAEQVIVDDQQAHFLHELNEIQLAFDRSDEQVKSLRRQIFADWSKYMLSQYPPDGADDDYPDPDKARFFIEHGLMPRLETLNDERQQLAKALRDHVQTFWHFRAGDIVSPAGLYQKIAQAYNNPPWLAAGIQNAEQLVQCLNNYIDNKGYRDAALVGKDAGAPDLSLEDILQRQRYQNHLVQNRLELEAQFPELPKHPDNILKRKPHHPFHRPADPVVLLSGDALKTTRKHGQDGMLANALQVVDGDLVKAAKAVAATLIPKDWQTTPGRHPMLLDWLVEFFPVEDTDFNLDEYEPGYLLDKYTLDLNTAELRATKDDLYSGVGQTFWGSALLATSGSKSLRQSLETFLIGELGLTDADLEDIGKHREAFFRNAPWMKKYSSQPVTPANFDAFYGWTPTDITPDELRELWAAKHKALALLAYEELRKTDFLSQALGGFTPALLMLREGYQLRIDDPLGYPEYQEFSRRVNGAVGLLNHASALPNNPFFPIRAGAASLLELRLLDTFGQEIVHLKDIPKVIAAETLRPQHTHHHFELNPRLSQPARLNFHWLSASDDEVEHNEHPASSPICGWVLLNYLDNSLMIYDQAGAALGYIDREGHWRSAPGQRPAILAEGIANWHLRRMVLWLMNKAKQGVDPAIGQSDTIPHFMTLVQDALRHVEPPRGDHAGEGVAMLMSRPLALVRATASIELKGLPAVNQSWAQFRQVIDNPENERESSLDIENVALPLRIGEDHQLNDGLIGFWEDAPDGETYLGDTFRLPSLHRATDANRDHTDEHQLDTLTAGADGSRGKALTFNLLMDPHGSVHATCGILPVQALTLPKDIYYDALERMEVSFLTSPLITPREMIHVSLPDEPGFQWSWVEIDRRDWREVSTVGHFRKQDLVAVFGAGGETLWDQLLVRGWILPDGDQAVIVPPARRPVTDNNFPPENLAPQLEHFLATRQIQPFQLIPAGKAGQEIREGWLKLRPMPELPSNIEE